MALRGQLETFSDNGFSNKIWIIYYLVRYVELAVLQWRRVQPEFADEAARSGDIRLLTPADRLRRPARRGRQGGNRAGEPDAGRPAVRAERGRRAAALPGLNLRRAGSLAAGTVVTGTVGVSSLLSYRLFQLNY
jgi:hypothetical protein